MSDIQKNKIAGLVDKRNLRPVKRRDVLLKRERERLQLQRKAEREDLLRTFKTVIVAQDRCGGGAFKSLYYLFVPHHAQLT